MSSPQAIACMKTPMVMQCREKKRRCGNKPFIYLMEHPPWYNCPPKCPVFHKPLVRRAEYDYELTYDFQNDYMPVSKQHKVMPTMAYWYYCDHVPDVPNRLKDQCQREQAGPWPPMPQGVCPAPVECEPCGPGPWANPEARKFFYLDCE